MKVFFNLLFEFFKIFPYHHSFSRSKYFHLLIAPIEGDITLIGYEIDRKIDVTAKHFLLIQNRQQTHDWTLIGSDADGLGIEECYTLTIKVRGLIFLMRSSWKVRLSIYSTLPYLNSKGKIIERGGGKHPSPQSILDKNKPIGIGLTYLTISHLTITTNHTIIIKSSS